MNVDDVHDRLLDRDFRLLDYDESLIPAYRYERQFDRETLQLRLRVYSEPERETELHLRHKPADFEFDHPLGRDTLSNADALLKTLDERLDVLRLDERSFRDACADAHAGLGFLYEDDPDYVQQHGARLVDVLEPFDESGSTIELLRSLHKLPEPERVVEALNCQPGGFELSESDTRTIAAHSGDLIASSSLHLRWDRTVAYLAALWYGQFDLVDTIEQQVNTRVIPTEEVLRICLNADEDGEVRGMVNDFRSDNRLRHLAQLHPVGRYLNDQAPKTYRAAHFWLIGQIASHPAIGHLQTPEEALRIAQGSVSIDSTVFGVALQHGWHDEAYTIIELYNRAECPLRIEPDLAKYRANYSDEAFEGAWSFLYEHRHEPMLDVGLRELFEFSLDDCEAFCTLLDERSFETTVGVIHEQVYRYLLQEQPDWIEACLKREIPVPDSLSSALIESCPEHEEAIRSLSQPRRIE